jgi:hypothetical protein
MSVVGIFYEPNFAQRKSKTQEIIKEAQCARIRYLTTKHL